MYIYNNNNSYSVYNNSSYNDMDIAIILVAILDRERMFSCRA